MPRRSRLVRCVRCKKKTAVIGAAISYYFVGQPMPQIRGSLPARGLCIACFLDVAKEQGVDRQKIVELRRKLEQRSNTAAGLITTDRGRRPL